MNVDSDKDELGQMLVKLTFIAQQLDQRSEQAVRRVEAGSAALEGHARQLHEGGEHFARQALQVIGMQAQQVVADHIAQASSHLAGPLRDAAIAAQRAARDLDVQRAQLCRAQSTLVWKGLGALVVGSLLAVGGCGYFAWNSLRQIAQAQFGADILHATQDGSLTRCGKQLCVKTGPHPQRYGHDYVVLPSSAARP